ncbi:MAG: SGNH/GDSL hydrolase family protein [Akkermansiaceae bacterium]
MKIFALLSLLAFNINVSAQSPIRPGDRIAIVGNTFADQLRIHGYLESLLLQHSKENPVSIRNLGWGGDMLTARDRPTNFPSEASTLTDHKTDVIIACFGFGESFAGEAGLTDFKNDLKDFITSHSGKTYNGTSKVRLILVSPIAYEDLARTTPNLEKRNSELKAYSQAVGEVAQEAKLPFVNLYDPSRYLMDEEGPKLTTNGVHLTPYGYWAISQHFAAQLLATQDYEKWQLTIDAKAGTGTATGVELSQIKSTDGSLHFRVKEQSAPSLAPPIDADLPPQLTARRDTLVVRDLKPGTHTLSIDGTKITSATHSAWSKGIPIDSSPTHQAAETYRELINDKNRQFVYSWKALNQVHIVGERRSSPSGKALPAEVIAFNKLAKQRDEDLRKGIQLKTRDWKLTPTSK